MPRPSGNPVSITLVNAQPMREVARFQAEVTYGTDGVPTYRFEAFTQVRLRDSNGVIVKESDGLKQLISLGNAGIPADVRTAFNSILARCDQIADPTP